MGLSHAVAAAILWTGVTVSTLTIVDDVFDHEATVDAAWRGARGLETEIAATAFSITAVTDAGGTIMVDLSNDGTATLGISAVTVLFDGAPVVVDAYTVEGAASGVWPAGTGARVNVTAAMPSAVWIASEHGALAVWRA